MTQTPLEKAARALAYLDWVPARHPDEEEHFQARRADYIQNVRVVLMAVREPGDAVIAAGANPEGWGATPELDKEAGARNFTAMIDHILRGGE